MNNKLENKVKKISYSLKDVNPHRAKHFSFLCKRNTILSVGMNSYDKTHTIAKDLGYRKNNIHSELDAVLRFEGGKKDIRNLDLVNIRLNRHGHVKMAMPCEGCTRLIVDLGIRRVWYTDFFGDFQLLAF